MNGYRSVLPGEPIRIAFLFQIASLWPSWESLYLFLSGDSRFLVKLFLAEEGVDKAKQSLSAGTFLTENNIPFERFTDTGFDDFTAHVSLLQTPYDYVHRRLHLYSARLKQKGIRVTYIPYGIEITDTRSARHNHFRESVIKNAWRVYTLSDDFKREYDKYCENAKAVRGFGLPRFDSLSRRELFPLAIDISKRARGRKIIVWHTHFAKIIDDGGVKKQVTPYLDEYIKFAVSIPEYKDALFFIFLPHPRFGDDAVDTLSNEKSEKILNTLRSHENAYVDTADDYRPSLLNADAIITDRSALAVESGIVGVPVLYLKNPDFEEPLFPPLIPVFKAYAQGTGLDSIRSFLKSFINGELKTCAVKIPNSDGACARRIADDISSSINDEEQDVKERRFILFGTGFVYQTMREVVNFSEEYEIIALSDNDSRKWGTYIDGILVIPPKDIINYVFDKVIICAENIFEEEIERQLLFDLEIPCVKIGYCDFFAAR